MLYRVAKGKALHLIGDNSTTHKHPAVQVWLRIVHQYQTGYSQQQNLQRY